MKLVFPEGSFQGEEPLIRHLATPVGTQQHILQQCNDGGEVIYVQFTKMQNGQEVLTSHGDRIPVPATLHYERIKRELRKHKVLSFVSVDSFCDEVAIPFGEPEVQVIPFVIETDTGALIYYDENMMDDRKGILLDKKTKNVVTLKATLPAQNMRKTLIFICPDRSAAKELKEDLEKILNGGRILRVSGMNIPRVVRNASTKANVVVEEVLVNEFKILHDKYGDVKELIPKINSWKDISIWRDVGTGEPFYNREVNELLMYNVCYVKIGRAVYNLILSGMPSTSKTSCATEYARIFEDTGKIVQAQGSTTKGLLPSFMGDTPMPGYLASPGFLKCVDEIFRHVSSQHENAKMKNTGSSLGEYLSRLLPILTRREQMFSSAKNNDYSVMMRAALLACDNLNDDVRIGLSTQVERDPAVLRRFTIIYLGNDEWERVKNATVVPSDDEVHPLLKEYWMKTYGFELEKLKRFAEWFRHEVANVHADSHRCHMLSRSILVERLRQEVRLGMLNEDVEAKIQNLAKKVDFVDHVRALVECSALMRAVYAETQQALPHKVHVTEEDYADAERIFKRIMEDCMVLFSKYLVSTVEAQADGGVPSFGGVKRV